MDLTPEQALQGERLELELADGTAVEVWTPPFAGDGWRLRLAGVTLAAETTSCSCGCAPRKDCASTACGCSTPSN